MKCLYPQRKRKTVNGSTFTYEHNCGSCSACRITRRSAWKARIMLESLDWTDSSFTTLTYSEEHVPIGISSDGCPQRELNYHDIKNFIKRLRKNTGRKLRYFACGEYGDRGNRPHYHIIIFGHRFTDTTEIEKAWSLDGKLIGNIDCGEFSTARAGYVAKYTLKRLGESKADISELPREFAVMSRRPGIGLQDTSNIIQAVYKAAKQTGETPVFILKNCITTISIGGQQLPIHPRLKYQIEKDLYKRERENLGDTEFEKQLRKCELRQSNQIDINLRLEGPEIRRLEEIDRKLLAERKLRQSNKRKSL